MQLNPAGREYASFPVTGLPATVGNLDVTFNDGATWTACTWVGTGADRTAKVLVAGPDATANPAGTAVLTVGRNYPKTRLVDNPEIVIRDSSGVITVE